jgi:ribosomal-protein-serine acetyltransferase
MTRSASSGAGLERFARDDGYNFGIWLGRRPYRRNDRHAVPSADPRTRPEIGLLDCRGRAGQGESFTRSVRAMTDVLFGELKLNRVEIQCATENSRAAGPSRSGWGSTQEGVLRDSGKIGERFVDHVVYSMLAREWKR